jgi:hypothetical protein
MDTNTQHTFDRAEQLRNRVIDFQEGRTAGSNVLLLHPLVEEVRALAAATSSEMPMIDLARDPAASTWRSVRAFLETLLTALRRDQMS